ncbi:MAG: ATP-binding protein [Lentisphaeria bacterium]|nr:ATP-binding protein [Lentisphaeria bacterium]NQZ70359.1 ATP-binding protein [Lentisphaeria bacterium]
MKKKISIKEYQEKIYEDAIIDHLLDPYVIKKAVQYSVQYVRKNPRLTMGQFKHILSLLDTSVINNFYSYFSGKKQARMETALLTKPDQAKLVAALENRLNEFNGRSFDVETRLELLKNSFKINAIEVFGLEFIFLMTNYTSLECFVELFINSAGYYNQNSRERCRLMHQFSEYSFTEISSVLNKSTLKKVELIDAELDIDSSCSEYLLGFRESAIEESFYRQSKKKPLPLSYFERLKDDSEILLKILATQTSSQNSHILLYGLPGTGKSEYALTLAKELKLHAYLINGAYDLYHLTRDVALKSCAISVEQKSSLIIIDEADSMLDGSELSRNIFLPSKDRVNELLDSVNGRCIWIANNIDYVDSSTLRRFDYSIKFDAFSKQQRIQLWKNNAKKHRLKISHKTASVLASSYSKLSAGGIDTALKNYKNISNESMIKDTALIAKLLDKHESLLSGDSRKVRAQPVKSYSLKGINIGNDGLSIGKVVSRLERFNEIGNGALNLLLQGPPGTGKTEFTRYLAKALDKSVHILNASELLSCWVGGTEANIRNAFELAQKDKAILFFDEVDGLLRDRNQSRNSWEVTQVNALLTEMENFNGIFIAATNYMDNLDRASLRRFSMKLRFDYLKAEGILHFYEIFFQVLSPAPLKAAEKNELSKIQKLSIGDFKVVKDLYMYDNDITHKDLITALKEEAQSRQKDINQIGFSE